METIKAYTIFAMFLIVLLFITNANGRRRNRHGIQRNDFDIFVYSFNWPPSACFVIQRNARKKACNMPDTNRWTIHGLWPSKLGSIGPQNCNKTLKFESSNLKSMEVDLQANWQVRDALKAHNWLWKHEWKKHGSCAVNLEALNSIEKYFMKGLEIYEKYNVTEMMEKANIIPGDRYNVNDILNEITSRFGKHGFAACIYDQTSKEYYLSEIRICFDKSLNLIDCDGIKGFPSTCPRKKKFYFPAKIPSH